MASNIATTAAFTGSNMKPAPGEQGDALWAQGIADNTGHVYYRHQPMESGRIFTKTPAHNALRGHVQGSGAGGGVTDYLRVFAQTQPFSSTGAVTLSGTMAYTRVVGSFHTMNLDISALINGSMYAVQFDPALSPGVAAITTQLVWGTAAPL